MENKEVLEKAYEAGKKEAEKLIEWEKLQFEGTKQLPVKPSFETWHFNHMLFQEPEAARTYHTPIGDASILDELQKDVHKLSESKCYLNPNNVLRDVSNLIEYYKLCHPKPGPTKGEWISVEDELPKLKTYYEGKQLVMQNSVEVIVTDGETSWADYYTSDQGFHPSITHWQPLPQPPTI